MLVLPVMVDGGPTAVQAEARLRARVAVLSALGVSGFEPADGEHIGYFTLPWPSSTSPGPIPKTFWDDFTKSVDAPKRENREEFQQDLPQDLLVPFEWCRARFGAEDSVSPAGTQDVLILWLRDEMFSDRPLLRLACLSRALDLARDKNLLPRRQHVSLRILGPRNSTTLRRMLEEAADNLDETTKSSLREASILSYCATASEEILMHEMPFGVKVPNQLRIGPRGDPTAEDLINYALRGVPAGQRDPTQYFARTIPTDDAVCTELVRELARRGVRAGSKDDPVVVLSESDTFYGRALPITFMRAAALEQVRAAASAGGARGPLDLRIMSLHDMHAGILKNQNYWNGIHWYSYFRGIDGRLPNEKPDNRGERGKGDAASRAATVGPPTGPGEQPEGLDQSDYLRRLADRLVDLDRKIKNDGNARGLRAVGVLGSDVYDKLMVLRALRPRLSGVLFFTNNLDARLGHPSEWDATHNLIVASSYGLKLHDNAQRNIAPFRDDYQTSTYAATLMATTALAAPRDPDENTPRVSKSAGPGRMTSASPVARSRPTLRTISQAGGPHTALRCFRCLSARRSYCAPASPSSCPARCCRLRRIIRPVATVYRRPRRHSRVARRSTSSPVPDWASRPQGVH
jgi:hypothetical protein